MDSYDVFGNETTYINYRAEALKAPMDKLRFRCAIHEMKDIYGSTFRKLLEVSNVHFGKFLDQNTIKLQLQHLNLHDETIRYLTCLIDAYNDNNAYRNRQIPIKKWKNPRAWKKHFHSYQLQGNRELQTYRVLFRSADDKRWFQAARLALIIYNCILKTFFVRKLPKRIALSLYDKCLQIDPTFCRYYKRDSAVAFLTPEGKCCQARSYGGLINTFRDDIIWEFVMYFLRFGR